MKRGLKIGRVFGVVILCSLAAVNSSSGITQFVANRRANMMIVDSNKALISIPSDIDIKILAQKETTNFYNLTLLKDNKQINKVNIIELDNKLYEKTLVDTTEIIKITNITNNLVISNNMPLDIELISITFNTPMLSDYSYKQRLRTGESKDITITKDSIYSDTDIINQIEKVTQATLEFKWDGGFSTIYADADILVEIDELDELENINILEQDN